MNDHIPKTRLRIGNPACYAILVQGAMDERWSGRLSGLSVKSFEPEGGFPVTRLSGEVLDQAALFGVLNTLYEMHLPLISVTHSEYDDAEESL